MSNLKLNRRFVQSWVLLVLLLLMAKGSSAQISFSPFEHLFTTPKHYTVPHTKSAPVIDGDVNDAAWQNAPWSDVFVDIEGTHKKAPTYATQFKMLWSDSCLFIAATLEEPHVWATLKNRDAIIYYDNDFEVFIDPSNSTHQYFEIEVNAFNTVLDLFMPKPYRNGAAAFLGYDITGLQSAVKIKGTINNPLDKDSGWTVEMAIPFQAIYRGNKWRPPVEGALWRLNFSRVQWDAEVVAGQYVKKKNNKGAPLPEHNWVWSPQGVINMHYPERWGYLIFTRNPSALLQFVLPYDEKQRQYAWLLYYRQQAYKNKRGRYATSLKQLGINTASVVVDGIKNTLQTEATTQQFTVFITDSSHTILINETGRVQKIKNPS